MAILYNTVASDTIELLDRSVAQELLKRGGGPELKELQEKIDSSGKPASFALAEVQVTGNVSRIDDFGWK